MNRGAETNAEADERLRKLQRACAVEAGRWLKESVNITKPINTLKIEELEGFAWAAISHYVVQVSKADKEWKRKLELPWHEQAAAEFDLDGVFA